MEALLTVIHTPTTPTLTNYHNRAFVETLRATSLQPEESEQTTKLDTAFTVHDATKPVETRHGTSLHQTQDASAPVVITREIPVTRTVVLHDTITVTDTIFLMHHDD